METGPVTQANQVGAPILQRSSWTKSLQQGQGSSGQIGTSGLSGSNDSATVTISTTAVLPTTQAQTETTPLTQTSFHVPTWAWYAGGAIIAFAVISFLISAFKDNSHN